MIQKNEASTIGAIKQLGEILNIQLPRRIELFDNSNIQGAYAVAGMVCFKDGTPSKKIIVNLRSRQLKDRMIMPV